MYGDDVTGDGSFLKPYRTTISKGLDAALEGDTVIVLPGDYAENVNLKSKVVLWKEQEAVKQQSMERFLLRMWLMLRSAT